MFERHILVLINSYLDVYSSHPIQRANAMLICQAHVSSDLRVCTVYMPCSSMKLVHLMGLGVDLCMGFDAGSGWRLGMRDLD